MKKRILFLMAWPVLQLTACSVPAGQQARPVGTPMVEGVEPIIYAIQEM